MTDKLEVTCCVTGTKLETGKCADGTPKLGRGWKAHQGKFYSPEGWSKCFVLRATTFPSGMCCGDETPSVLRDEGAGSHLLRECGEACAAGGNNVTPRSGGWS